MFGVIVHLDTVCRSRPQIRVHGHMRKILLNILQDTRRSGVAKRRKVNELKEVNAMAPNAHLYRIGPPHFKKWCTLYVYGLNNAFIIGRRARCVSTAVSAVFRHEGRTCACQ